MKNSLLTIVLLALLLGCASCEKPAPHKTAPPPAPAESAGKTAPSKPQKKPITDGVAETLDYGVTVGKTYNKSKAKIQNIQDERNRQMEEALKDMP